MPTGISVVLEPVTFGALSCEPPSLPLLHALSTEVDAAATPVAIRKFLREKDIASCLVGLMREIRHPATLPWS